MGLKNALDKAAFAGQAELLSREVTVPARWHCSLGSALECMFHLFEVHGVVKGDAILIRPGLPAE